MEGLAEQVGFMGDTGEPNFQSTEKGWNAREDWLVARGLRHPALRGECNGEVTDIALACIAASAIWSERIPPGYWHSEGGMDESVLAFHLGRCNVRDTSTVVMRLQSRGFARHKPQAGILLTASGRRHYETVVAPRLRIPSPSTILDFQRIGSVPLFKTDLPADLAQNLLTRWAEADICSSNGAYLAATLMYASVAEGVLGWWARERCKEALTAKSAPKDRSRNPLPVEQWNLFALIQVAKELGWLDLTMGDFVDQLRNVRNLVHPWKQLRDKTVVDKRICTIAKMVAEAAIEVSRSDQRGKE